MSLTIFRFPHKALRTRCEPVTAFDQELHRTLDEMKGLMLAAKGIGLAANQVGILKNFFIIEDQTTKIIHEIMNPKIIERSEELVFLEEGCLSLPNFTLKLSGRSEDVVVKFQDRNGEERTGVFQGIEAVCVQHEMEHLDGIAFFDKASRNIRRVLKKRGIE